MIDTSTMTEQELRRVIFQYIDDYPFAASTTEQSFSERIERKFNLCPGWGSEYIRRWIADITCE